jgi:hypothetical protein
MINVSLEIRLTMRPLGLVSKNFIFEKKIALLRFLNIFDAASKAQII